MDAWVYEGGAEVERLVERVVRGLAVVQAVAAALLGAVSATVIGGGASAAAVMAGAGALAVIAFGLWRLREWARWTTIVLVAAGTVLAGASALVCADARLQVSELVLLGAGGAAVITLLDARAGRLCRSSRRAGGDRVDPWGTLMLYAPAGGAVVAVCASAALRAIV